MSSQTENNSRMSTTVGYQPTGKPKTSHTAKLRIVTDILRYSVNASKFNPQILTGVKKNGLRDDYMDDCDNRPNGGYAMTMHLDTYRGVLTTSHMHFEPIRGDLTQAENEDAKIYWRQFLAWAHRYGIRVMP